MMWCACKVCGELMHPEPSTSDDTVVWSCWQCKREATITETHIENATEPTFGIDAFDCFMEQAFGMKRAKSGSETQPNQGTPDKSPETGDNTNGIKSGSATNRVKTHG